ncbi:MAG TPA: TOBE domain-containing protein, partial [Spirochaetota bacterium]|nr:TOBE domain-containing protein [Spirochaetota bacterium]
RPEKIRVTKEEPHLEGNPGEWNVLRGTVDEVIYTGFQSKYFVKIGSCQIRVFKQHVMYQLDETPINWKEDVYVWWNSNDGYLVEVEGR